MVRLIVTENNFSQRRLIPEREMLHIEIFLLSVRTSTKDSVSRNKPQGKVNVIANSTACFFGLNETSLCK